MKSSFFIVLAILFCSLSTSAYEMNYVVVANRTAFELTSSSTAKLILKDPNVGLTVAPTYKYKINLSYTRAQLTDISTMTAWDYTLTLVLRIKDANGNVINSTPAFNLSLHSQNIATDPTNNIYEDVILFDNQYTWLNNPNAEVYVTTISPTNPTDLANIPSDISLEMTQIQSITEALDNSKDPLLSKTADNKTIGWDYITGAQWYELEWVYIDAYDGTTSFPNLSDAFLYKEPIKISTPYQFFNFHNTYPQGAVYFRIRGATTAFNYTNWYYGSGTTIINAVDFEPLKNWQATTTYIENGKYKKSIVFADGSTRTRQSQTSMNSDNTVIISETKYDFEGKPVINIMPFPYGASTSMNYVANLNTFNVAQGVHQKTAYDNQMGSLAMSTGAGSSQYYSGLNPFSASINQNYIADAQGYPYSQVVYTPDNTGRIAKSAQVGNTFKIFTPIPGNEKDQHFVQNFYASPSSTELYRMFGSNVGQASHYSKTYGVDENGVISISYHDDEGKLVASALSEVPTTNLVSVVDPYNQTALNADGSSTNRLSNQNDIDAKAHISLSTDKIVKLTTGNQPYTFKYDLNSSLDNQFGICLSCAYTFELTITDPDGFSVIKDAQQNTIPYYTQNLTPTLNGCTSATYPTVSQTYTFTKIGEYTISKKLYYNTASIQALTTSITTTAPVSINLDDKTYTDKTAFVKAFVAKKTTEANCGFTCESNCTNYSNSFLNKLNPASGAFYTAAEIAAIKSACLASCGADIANITSQAPTMQCDSYKQQMLSQVSPGGCYNTVAFITNAQSQGAVFTPAASVTDLMDPIKFTPAWAQSLLPYHVEYCIYSNTCLSAPGTTTPTPLQTALVGSTTYDAYQFGSGDATAGATGWNDAASKGYLRPLSNLTMVPSFTTYGLTFNMSPVPSTKLDPFFLTYSAQATALQSKLINYYYENTPDHIDYNGDGVKSSIPLSAWEFASCYNRNNDGTFNHTMPLPATAYDVNRWAIFKGIYLAEKDKLVQVLLTGACANGYQDPTNPNTVIRKQPQNFDATTQAKWTAWANSPDQVSNACSDDVCQERAQSALRELFSQCANLEANITANDRAEVIYNLYKYFQDGCSTYNRQKLIRSTDLTNIYLARVNTILGEPYYCSLNPIVTVTNNNNCIPIPADPNKMIPSSSLLIYIDLINDYLNINRNNIAANPVANTTIAFNPALLTFTPIYNLPSAIYNRAWFSGIMNSFYGNYPVSGVAITQDINNKSIQMYFLATDNVTIFVAKTGMLESIQSLNLNLSSVKMIANITVDEGPLNRSIDPNPVKYQIITMDNTSYQSSIGTVQSPNGDFGIWTDFMNSWKVGNSVSHYASMIDQITPKIYCPATTNPFFVDFNLQAQTDTCTARQSVIATAEANAMWAAAVNDQMQTALATHYTGCFSTPFTENFYYTTTDPKQLYYTLYYYDQAGNLVQTVPPEGVRLLGSSAFDAKGTYLGILQPPHGLITHYKYNSLNQAIYKMTPDESGPNHNIPSYTFYNDKGQPVVSQNARQATSNIFSCISYDALGRVTKVGDIVNTTLLTDLLDRTKYDQNVLNYWNTDLLTASNVPTDIVATTYDIGVGSDPSYTNRGRVTKVTRALNLANLNATNLDSYISYQYDIHGNVKTLSNAMPLSQSIPGAPLAFTVDYTYDLLSGSVKKVILDNGLASQFMHCYTYDADNRLKTVKTSRNGLVWEEDARYYYYLHGPLARTELGEDRVQGTDYYYTLQGWIKGMNTPALKYLQVGSNVYNRTGVGSIGGDGASFLGTSNALVAQDEYAMNLGYYSGDYTPIGNPLLTPQGLASTNATANLWTSFNATGLQGLYNGNIAYWTNNRGRAINGNNIFRQNAYVFQYDQLNRIRNAYYTTALGNNNGEYIWAPRITTTPQLNDFSASYDLNGNMKTMQRYDGNATLIDNLTYNYNYQAGQSGVLLDNKLNNVNDDLNTSGIANYDIDNQTNAFNYTYDNIGNLVGDVSEQIANIGWNREGKVISLTRSTGSLKPDFIFKYDVSGKRIYKQVMNKTPAGLIDNTKTTYTYYAYDGTGNLLATYDQVAISSPMDIRQVDANVFGSDRLGVYAHATPILRNAFLNNALTNVSTTTQLFHRTPGYKQYELKDHLGNVRSVITGIKVGVYLATTNTPGAAFYVADVVSENDYYPFGMLMTGTAIYRRNSTSTYKFGYNGKVMDNDWNGEGAMYDYGFRIYDPRICKFLSVDPLSPSYPELTPYQFASNMPIGCVDLDGLEAQSKTGQYIGPRCEAAMINDGYTYEDAFQNTPSAYRVKKAQEEKAIVGSFNKTMQDPKSSITPKPPMTSWQKYGFFDFAAYGGFTAKVTISLDQIPFKYKNRMTPELLNHIAKNPGSTFVIPGGLQYQATSVDYGNGGWQSVGLLDSYFNLKVNNGKIFANSRIAAFSNDRSTGEYGPSQRTIIGFDPAGKWQMWNLLQIEQTSTLHNTTYGFRVLLPYKTISKYADGEAIIGGRITFRKPGYFRQ
jgi:RHS repeat-associated protein